MDQISNSPQNWKTPNELIKIHQLKRKEKALQARLQNQQLLKEDTPILTNAKTSQKRKNPFAKNSTKSSKKSKIELQSNSQDSFFEILSRSRNFEQPEEKIKIRLRNFNFQELLTNDSEVEEQIENSGKNIPIDWSIKTRIRLLSKTSLPGINLKTSQEASGLTSFVRCINSQDIPSSLDISPGARFHQCKLYWQHPHLPWLTLFPRNAKANVGFQIGNLERIALMKDWMESFRCLFQLLRVRQCPYFYLCANTFTVLFRAAGIGGRQEIHAFLSPTSRGMRKALKQEDIEFTQPLKIETNLSKSNEISESFSNSSEEQSNDIRTDLEDNDDDDDDDDDEVEEEKWLESLGVDANEIKKINANHAREILQKETAEDFSQSSIILIEGADCQGLFNFLLNAKSTVANIGKLAGVPPTLLAPVAFPGSSLRTLQARSSKVRIDSIDYFSVELKGIILPSTIPYICSLLSESNESFIMTMTSNPQSLSFTKASQKLINDTIETNKTSDEIFGKENLSDCGIPKDILDSMCRISKDAVSLLERMWYVKDPKGYTWL